MGLVIANGTYIRRGTVVGKKLEPLEFIVTDSEGCEFMVLDEGTTTYVKFYVQN